jgi:hypothetical protein
MNIRYASILTCAAFAIGSAAAIAQSPSLTVSGCVQKQSLVLKGAPVAANAGMDDEFVLTNAKPGAAPVAGEPAPAEPKPEATGTSGSAGNFGIVYRLSGDKEKELKSYVGQRVEISGAVKEKEKATDAMSSAGTGARELTPANTAEITVDSIKPLSGACTPAIK